MSDSQSFDTLQRSIHKCSTHHTGAGFLVRVDGILHRPNTSIEMLALLARAPGGRIRYRVKGFADGTRCKMAAVVTTYGHIAL